MAMDIGVLGLAIRDALGFSDQPVSTESKGMASAIIKHIKANGLVSFAPGGVTGEAPSSGGPMQNGAGANGTIAGLSGPGLAEEMRGEMGLPSITKQLKTEAQAICDEVMKGVVSFEKGQVTGGCTNSPTSPGPMAGAAANGKISGISAPSMANTMASAMGGPATAQLQAMAAAISSHIMTSAVVSFVMGGITGACSPGGGSVSLGAGAAGKIV